MLGCFNLLQDEEKRNSKGNSSVKTK